jgi:branched-chain amino acid transport system substrate-binding protein
LLACTALAVAPPALAQVKIGVTLSQTGPAASLGIPERNTVALLPTEIGGQTVEYIVLDDASDTTKAVANARKLADESGVDAIVGSSTTPASLAMVPVAAEKETPMLSLAASVAIIAPMDAQRRWVFKMAHGVKSVGFIGFNDAYGDGWLREATRALDAKGIKLIATERFARTDTSTTGQVLHVVAAHPDAVLIAASGTPAALPERELRQRGFKGGYYQTHGVANSDFLRVGGHDVDGTVLPAGPVLVAAQLPDSNPVKPVALDYTRLYEAKYGEGSLSTFGAHAWDAGLLLRYAIPIALKQAKPGTPEFRAALRDALEGAYELVVSQGMMDMTPENHNGFDDRARVMVEIEGGTWKLIGE